jgi:alkane 1-monooxygenase
MSSATFSEPHAGNKPNKQSGSAWIRNKRYWYLLAIVTPFIPLGSAYMALETGQGAWFWFTIVFLYGMLPLADHLFGEDKANPDETLVQELKDERYYVYIMYAATALHWVSLVGVAYIVSQYDWSWLSILGGALSAGILNGLGLVAGHEMGHKVKDRRQVAAAKIMLATSGYGHFFIEHNKGHHKDVATPEDPASSRLGEGIYKFVKREIPGAFRRAWRLETERLQRQGKSEWSWDNEILQPAALTLSAYTLMLAYFGPVMIPFLLISAGYGWWQLTCANYVEHYGLLRLKNDKGRYERCQPHHSWNSNHKASNLILLHLQRHSDHHAHPTRPYQVLRDYDDVPSLPSGYPLMFLVAMIPPLWFSIMDKKVIDWAASDMNKVNIDPARREEFFMRYHHPAEAENSPEDITNNKPEAA